MNRIATFVTVWTLALAAADCLAAAPPVAKREVIAAAKIERRDPAMDSIIPKDAQIEKLAEGFGWAEGPVWISSGSYLLFTDVPGNRMWKWPGMTTANCKFVDDGRTLYPTSSNMLARIRLTISGATFPNR